MVLKFKKYPNFVIFYAKTRHLRENKPALNFQRKHLSEMVPFQNKPGLLRMKIEELVKWYDEFTGMDEVRNAQKRVLEDEKNFRKTQEERRFVVNQLTEMQNKIKELYSELDNTNRGEERYVYLVTQEHKLLKEEKLILDRFSAAEKKERDAFTALSTSVKLSHEKERAQSERTKYWSIIGSILGTVMGILGTSINNHFKMKELKELIKTSSDKKLIENLHEFLETNEKLLIKLKENEKEVLKANGVTYVDVLNKLNSRLDTLEISLSNIEKNTNINNIDSDMFNKEGYKSIPMEALAESLKKEYKQTKMLLITLVVFSVIVPIITKCS